MSEKVVKKATVERAFAANQSSNAATSFDFLVFGFEFKNLSKRYLSGGLIKEWINCT
jgi:hypothetical protein